MSLELIQQSAAEASYSAQRKRRNFKLSLSVLSLFILCAGLYWHLSSVAQHSEGGKAQGGERFRHRFGHDDNQPVVVAVETVGLNDFPVYLNGLGTITPLRTVTVHSRVDGELQRVTFNEGQLVKEGDLLAEIDPRPFQVQLQQVQGQLQRDQALLKNAELDLARYQTLQAQDSISAQQAMTQVALVKQYQGNVEMDQALVDNAKLQLSYARLTAPISGRVGLRQIDQGNMIHVGDNNGLVVITQLQPINVVFSLPEDKVPALIQRGNSAKVIRVTAYDRAGKNKLAEGKLTAIDNQIDPTTGTLKLKAQFDNHEQSLFANQFVNIRMHLDTLPGVATVSSSAVQHDGVGPFLYVIDQEHKAQMRRVTLGPGSTEDDKVAVLTNLTANETVVVEGYEQLKDGSKIDIAQQDGHAVMASPENAEKTEGKFPRRDRRS